MFNGVLLVQITCLSPFTLATNDSQEVAFNHKRTKQVIAILLPLPTFAVCLGKKMQDTLRRIIVEKEQFFSSVNTGLSPDSLLILY